MQALRDIAMQRARLKYAIRDYFAGSALEVDTPIMDSAGNTDPAIESFALQDLSGVQKWLRTSPEFFHKRLLAHGFGDLFEFATVFRDEEYSKRHRHEFTLLEYYRVGMDDRALIRDITALFQHCAASFNRAPFAVMQSSYRDWFQSRFLLDPMGEELSAWQRCAADCGAMSSHTFDRDQCLDYLRASVLELELPTQTLCFITDFPASQAALARLHANGLTAARFELFIDGIELANGYHELQDATEQAQRFARDLQKRQSLGMRAVAIDHALLEALARGLPECAGVAIGFERMLMVLSEVRDIARTQLF